MYNGAGSFHFITEEGAVIVRPSLSEWQRDERGATAVEYGLMVGLIAIVIIGGVSAFGFAVSDLFLVPAGVFK